MKSILNRFHKKLAQLGRSMLVPVTAMPIAGILSRIASPDMLNLPLLKAAGDIVFGNMDILFAFGAVVAFAKAKDKISPIVASFLSILVLKSTLLALDESINMGIFAGIIVGCFTAWIFNQSKEWKTPKIFDFFTGEKFVITLAPVFTVALGYLLSFIWPSIQNALDIFAVGIASLGAVGVFIFGFLNRLLIPVGLHHVFNSYIYFNLGSYTTSSGDVVTGEMTRFLAGDPSAGLFLSMFFVVMMFGLPGAALAMYQCAKKRKNEVKGLMSSAAITSFITGITEPLEFSFMFVAPQLYVVHALYTGLAGAVCYLLGIRIGFSSGGNIIDLVLNWGLGSHVILIIPVGIVFFVLYFLTFRFLITRYNLKTLGREDDFVDTEEVTEEEKNATLSNKNYAYMAKKILENLGGASNIETIGNCMTRLRVEVKNPSLLNLEKIKQMGVRGVVKLSDTSIQIIIGSEVRYIMNEINQIIG
ncbi:MAG: PTS transporter subunit EIIC [Butyricicoccus sp.]